MDTLHKSTDNSALTQTCPAPGAPRGALALRLRGDVDLRDRACLPRYGSAFPKKPRRSHLRLLQVFSLPSLSREPSCTLRTPSPAVPEGFPKAITLPGTRGWE